MDLRTPTERKRAERDARVIKKYLEMTTANPKVAVWRIMEAIAVEEEMTRQGVMGILKRHKVIKNKRTKK